MTVSSETAKSGPYTGNGATTVFAYGFKIFAESDLQVILTDTSGVETVKTLTTHYTVSGVGNSNGGNVTMLSAPASGEKITILRDMTFTQTTDLRNQGGFYPEVHERVFDRLTMMVGQLKESVDRAVQVDPSSSTDPADLIDDLLAAASDATDAAAAAATSETNAATSETNAAASAVAAQAAASSVFWNDVVFLTSADSPYTVQASQRSKLFAVDTTGGAVTINLPQISTLTLTSAWVIGIKKTNAGTNAVTIARTGTDTIDGGTSKSITGTDVGCALIPDTDTAPDEWTSVDFGSATGNIVFDPFTGDGATTGFTLTASPGASQACAVYVDGVRQAPGTDYTVSGTTLTFSTAPANLSVVYAFSNTAVAIGVPSDGTVTNAKMSTMATQTFKGRTTAGTGNVEDLTATQATAILNAMVGDSGSGGTKGLVPAPSAGDAAANKFLKASGTWATAGVTKFTSSDQTITSAGSLTLAHGLGAEPFAVQVELVCQSTEANYSVNDVVVINPHEQDAAGSSNRGVAIIADATNLNIRYGSAAGVFSILNKTTGAGGTLTNGNWKARFKAWV